MCEQCPVRGVREGRRLSHRGRTHRLVPCVRLLRRGDELTPRGRHRCNVRRGDFPVRNTGEDGFPSTAPSAPARPTASACTNTSGNVREWCADRFSADRHVADRPTTRVDPVGPPAGGNRVLRGGSYLCHSSCCTRYRVAARTSNTPDSTTGHG
ncbi:formylglycine-generating enzyme family protein [Streptomyces sp. NPDC127117]|uniref:formylglycine-generating enzyme family protein n=1 Tax=Streptomyces sp. NPDC127117 TaxID=3345368 RepID=UPI003639133B